VEPLPYEPFPAEPPFQEDPVLPDVLPPFPAFPVFTGKTLPQVSQYPLQSASAQPTQLPSAVKWHRESPGLLHKCCLLTLWHPYLRQLLPW